MLRRPIIAMLFLTLTGITSVPAAPALWQISDEDSSIWVFGGLHSLPEHLAWRSVAFDKVFTKAERVYFEQNADAFDTAALLPLVVDVGFNTGATLLSDQIEPAVMDQVRDAAALYQLDMPLLLAMKPWLAAVMISGAVDDWAKYNAAIGVASMLQAELTPERTGYLETPEDQIRLFGGVSAAEQVEMLKGVLRLALVPQDVLDRLVFAWADGKPEALGSILAGQFGSTSGGDNSLLATRHLDWIGQIEAMLLADEQVLLVVDLANLVGDTSLLRRLEARGFASTRIQ